MSKIICDVCGTSYPETALQCPICGCVRPGEVKVVAGDTTQPAEEKTANSYTYVKGGRFSKANVKKRNGQRGTEDVQDVLTKRVAGEQEPVDPSDVGKKKSDIGLTITVIVLLLAIVAVVLYIVLRFFTPAFSNKDPQNQPISTTTEQTEASHGSTADTTIDATEDTTADPTEDTITTELSVDGTVTLQQAEETFQLSVKGITEGSTVTFVSEDEAVATVSEEGVVTAVSAGETVITVTCGDEQVSCAVICDFPEDATDPTEEETTAPTIGDPDAVYYISHEDVTLLTGVEERKSFVLTLKDEQGNVVDVTWQDDKNLCKIDGNTITAEKTGSTSVYTVVNGVKYACTVIIWYEA